jgi:ATP-dependent Clp endopeptidase proteolytic subunit ClpP
MSDRWYKIRAQADTPDEVDVLIYDQIGEGFFTEGVTALTFARELAAITAPRINVRINSPGGSVFDGLAIYNSLKRHPAHTVVHIDGLAASIASVIALAGDEVHMAANALFMIHNPWGLAQGDARELRKIADTLDLVRDQMIETYRQRCALTDEELMAALDAETWYTAAEAVEVGFVDQVTGQMALAASAAATFDLSIYRNAPSVAAITTLAAAAAADPEKETEMTEPTAAAMTPPAPIAPVARPAASAHRLTVGHLFAAAARRDADPAGWAATLSQLSAMAETPGDGLLAIPTDVTGVLPTPIVQEIHSWMIGARPVSELFGLSALPFREGPSFTWPYVSAYPNTDLQAAPGDEVYKTNIQILGKPFTKVTIGAQLKVPFQEVWTSPSAAAEVAKQMVRAYAKRYEALVSASLVAAVTAETDLAANADADAVAAALLEAIETVDEVTNEGANCIIASRDQVRRLRALRDSTKRPVYPIINPTNADGQVQGGELWIEGIRVTRGPALPEGTLIVGHTAGYKTFDDGANFATQDVLSSLSRNDVVYGFGAYGVLDAAAFTKLTAPGA